MTSAKLLATNGATFKRVSSHPRVNDSRFGCMPGEVDISRTRRSLLVSDSLRSSIVPIPPLRWYPGSAGSNRRVSEVQLTPRTRRMSNAPVPPADSVVPEGRHPVRIPKQDIRRDTATIRVRGNLSPLTVSFLSALDATVGQRTRCNMRLCTKLPGLTCCRPLTQHHCNLGSDQFVEIIFSPAGLGQPSHVGGRSCPGR
jgi:hypothetical protein